MEIPLKMTCFTFFACNTIPQEVKYFDSCTELLLTGYPVEKHSHLSFTSTYPSESIIHNRKPADKSLRNPGVEKC